MHLSVLSVSILFGLILCTTSQSYGFKSGFSFSSFYDKSSSGGADKISPNAKLCVNFKSEISNGYYFITAVLGTPLVPYRLLLCTAPSKLTQSASNIVLLRDSFGGIGMSGHDNDRGENMGQFVSKSVTFQSIHSDALGTIGRDYLRTFDGSWIDTILEIPSIYTNISTFDFYCNPGGLGDMWYSVYENKYDRIDGFFVVTKESRLIYDISTQILNGISYYSLKEHTLKYCYIQQEDWKQSISVYMNRKAKSDSVLLHSELGISKPIKESTQQTHHKKKTTFDELILGNSFTTVKSIVSDNNDNITKNDENQHYIVYFRKKKNINVKYIPQFYKKPSIHSNHDNNIFDMNMRQHYGKKANAYINDDISEKHGGNYLVTSVFDKINYEIKFIIDQPYTYLPIHIYNAYFANKNIILDIPDEQWENICLKLKLLNTSDTDTHNVDNNNNNSNTNHETPVTDQLKTDKNHTFRFICLDIISIIKGEFLVQKKNGHMSYFPSSSDSKLTAFNMISGGRVFGNTIVGNNVKSMYTTEYTRSRVANVFGYTQDKHFMNNVNMMTMMNEGLVSGISSSTILENMMGSSFITLTKESNKNSSFNRPDNGSYNNGRQKFGSTYKNIYQQALNDMNRFLILPHYGPENIIYLGSSVLHDSSISVDIYFENKEKPITQSQKKEKRSVHSTEPNSERTFLDQYTSMNIYIERPIGFAEMFQVKNLDISDNTYEGYFIMNIIFSIVYILLSIKIRALSTYEYISDGDKLDMVMESMQNQKENFNDDIKEHKGRTKSVKSKNISLVDLRMELVSFVIFGIGFFMAFPKTTILITESFSMIDTFYPDENMINIHVVFVLSTLVSYIIFFVCFLSLLVAILISVFTYIYHSNNKTIKRYSRWLKKERCGIKLPNIFKVIKEEYFILENVRNSDNATNESESNNDNHETQLDNSPIFESEKLYIQVAYHNYIYFMTLLLLYIISSTHVVFMSTQSSSIIRFWNLIGYLFLLLSLGHCMILQFKLFDVLFFTDLIVCCVLGTTKTDFASLIMTKDQVSDYRHQMQVLKDNFKCNFLSIIQVTLILILNFVVSIMLILYIIPYELEVSQSDYSGDHIKYIASILCVAIIYFLTIELFEYNWRSTDGFFYNMGYLKFKLQTGSSGGGGTGTKDKDETNQNTISSRLKLLNNGDLKGLHEGVQGDSVNDDSNTHTFFEPEDDDAENNSNHKKRD